MPSSCVCCRRRPKSRCAIWAWTRPRHGRSCTSVAAPRQRWECRTDTCPDAAICAGTSQQVRSVAAGLGIAPHHAPLALTCTVIRLRSSSSSTRLTDQARLAQPEQVFVELGVLHVAILVLIGAVTLFAPRGKLHLTPAAFDPTEIKRAEFFRAMFGDLESYPIPAFPVPMIRQCEWRSRLPRIHAPSLP